MRVRRSTFYAVLVCEAAVCLDDFTWWNTSGSFERVYVLREACMKKSFLGKEPDERVGRGGSEFARRKLVSKYVD